MLTILPLLFFTLVFIASWYYFQNHKNPSYEIIGKSALVASIFWGISITIITELLSFFRYYNKGILILSWVLFCCGALFFLIRLKKNCSPLSLPSYSITDKPFEKFLIAFIAFSVLIVGLIAIISPPNTWDSMTYHMSRIMHWIANETVWPYPSHIPRQVVMTPWAEYAIMNFQILTESDRYANLIQWFSFVGAVLGVGLIAGQIGAERTGKIFAMVFVCTLPMGILQGSSTQTDYVLSFWMICLVYFALLCVKEYHIIYALAVGAALGLATLTKATAYIFSFPLVLGLVVYFFLRQRKQLLSFGIFASGTFLLTNLAFFLRNIYFFGQPLVSDKSSNYLNSPITLGASLSNVLRNISLHLATPSKRLNLQLEDLIIKVHSFFGANANDPGTTWSAFHILPLNNVEDLAGNPLHISLILFSVGYYFIKMRKERLAGLYTFCIAVSFFLFCLFLKWQPWHSRLHLPLFILMAPAVAICMTGFRRQFLIYYISMVLVFASFPWLLYNYHRPLLISFPKKQGGPQGFKNIIAALEFKNIFTIDRDEIHFIFRPKMYNSYKEAVGKIQAMQCKKVGLIMTHDDWEYPLWVIGQNQNSPPGFNNIRYYHVNVKNETGRFKNKQNTYCALISTRPLQEKEQTVNNVIYEPEWTALPITLWRRQ